MDKLGTLGRPARILLVDDNADDIRLTQLTFARIDAPHELFVASDGDEAMAILNRDGKFSEVPRPDVILLDLNMPGKDGREVLKEIKRDENLKRIPVVILSTSDAAMDRLLTYNEYANAFLTKPIDWDELQAMLEAFVNFWVRFVHFAP